MTLSPTQQASVASIGLATLISLLLNCAPHGSLLPVERLQWIALSLFLYSSIIILCLAVPAHLVLQRLRLDRLLYYLAAAVIISCIAYAILYRVIEGGFWPGGMVKPLAYNALVALLVAPCFYYLACRDKANSR